MRKAILPSVLILGALLAGACGAGQTIQPTPDVSVARTSAAQTVIAEFTLTGLAFTPTLEPLPTETLSPTPSTPEATATTGTQVIVVTNASGVPVEVTATPIPCDSMTFDPATVDINIPDGSQMTTAQQFVKTWKIKNNGSCAWGDGYGLIYAYGDRMSGQPNLIGTVVQVGQEVEVSISLKAPSKAGEYTSAWQMANAKGVPFGRALYVKILVK